MDGAGFADVSLDTAQKGEEFSCPVALHAVADGKARFHTECGERVVLAWLVVVARGGSTPLLRRQPRLGLAEYLAQGGFDAGRRYSYGCSHCGAAPVRRIGWTSRTALANRQGGLPRHSRRSGVVTPQPTLHPRSDSAPALVRRWNWRSCCAVWSCWCNNLPLSPERSRRAKRLWGARSGWRTALKCTSSKYHAPKKEKPWRRLSP